MSFFTMTFVARANPLALSTVTDLITGGGASAESKAAIGIGTTQILGSTGLISNATSRNININNINNNNLLLDVTERQSVRSKTSDGPSDGSRSPTVSIEKEPVSEDEECFTNYDEQWLVAHLTTCLENILREAKGKRNCWQVLLPRTLTSQVAEDLMGMSDCEPCGIRGCVLYIELEEQDGTGDSPNLNQLGHIVMSAETVPTFEMRLTLKRNTSGWLAAVGFQKLMQTVGRDTIVISDNYCLRKKRLYR